MNVSRSSHIKFVEKKTQFLELFYIVSTRTIYFNKKKTSCIRTLHEIESDSDLSTFLYTLYKNQAIGLTLTLMGVVMKLARLMY